MRITLTHNMIEWIHSMKNSAPTYCIFSAENLGQSYDIFFNTWSGESFVERGPALFLNIEILVFYYYFLLRIFYKTWICILCINCHYSFIFLAFLNMYISAHVFSYWSFDFDAISPNSKYVFIVSERFLFFELKIYFFLINSQHIYGKDALPFFVSFPNSENFILFSNSPEVSVHFPYCASPFSVRSAISLLLRILLFSPLRRRSLYWAREHQRHRYSLLVGTNMQFSENSNRTQ
jgi:hypothetical protein